MLAVTSPSRELIKLPHHDLDLCVDASTSWGIGLYVSNRWAAWRLVDSWNTCGQDIGWAEAMVIELAISWLTKCGWQNACIKIHCDNDLVITSFWKGRSRNPPQNDSICRISSSLTAANLTIDPTYVPSAINKADPLSRGLSGPESLCIEPRIVAPLELCLFIIEV